MQTQIHVEQGVDVVNLKVGDQTRFSIKVDDSTASSAFGKLKSALERAKKSLMPKAQEAEVVSGDLPCEKTRKTFLTPDSFNDKMNEVVNYANDRLAEILGAKGASESVIAFAYDGGRCIVRSGDREIADEITTDDIFKSFKRCKSAIWRCVDDAKPWMAKKTQDGHRDAPRNFGHEMESVVGAVNEKLREIGASEIAMESDAVGTYFKSGALPVASLPKVGNAKDALKKASDKLWSYFNSVKGSTERQKQTAERASEIEANSSWDLAFVKRANPEADVTRPWSLGPNPEIASAIVKAANDSAAAFNKGLPMMFGEISDLLGGRDEMKMSVKGFTRGIVVSFGKTPFLITMFPLVGNNATTDEIVAGVVAKVAAVGESRIEHYRTISAEYSRQEKMRELAEKRAAIDEELKAMAM